MNVAGKGTVRNLDRLFVARVDTVSYGSLLAVELGNTVNKTLKAAIKRMSAV